MSADDLYIRLGTAIAAAASGNLSRLAITRVGTSEVMWQASSRIVGEDAYRVDIQRDPLDAILGVLGPRQVPSAPPAASAEHEFPPEVVDLYEQIEAEDPQGRARYDADVASATGDGLFD